MDHLKILFDQAKFDNFLAISATKLDENIPNAFVSIENYSLFRLDRNRHGGGVVMFVHGRFKSSSLRHLSNKNHEALWVKVSIPKANPFTPVLFIDLPLLIDLLTRSLNSVVI